MTTSLSNNLLNARKSTCGNGMQYSSFLVHLKSFKLLWHILFNHLYRVWLKNKFCSEAFHVSNNNYVHFLSLNGIATIFHFSITLISFHIETLFKFYLNYGNSCIACLQLCQETLFFFLQDLIFCHSVNIAGYCLCLF